MLTLLKILGVAARAAVPSGASTGVYEAVELRDNDPQDHFGKCNNILFQNFLSFVY